MAPGGRAGVHFTIYLRRARPRSAVQAHQQMHESAFYPALKIGKGAAAACLSRLRQRPGALWISFIMGKILK